MAPARRRRRYWPLIASLALFALVGAALLAAGGLIVRTVHAERTERALLARTDAILVAIDDIDRAAVNAESGQRGYFITLDRRYLAPYEIGRAAWPVGLRRLRGLLGGLADPRIGALLTRIEQVGGERFDELDRSVAMINEGRVIEARQAILSDQGQRLMQRLRATLAELERIERERLAVAGDETAMLESRILPLLGSLLAIVSVALALGLWQVARASRAEALVAQAGELSDARDRADLLARELNHRVKNLFSVVLGIVRMTGRGHPEAKPTIDRIAERIHALAKAHEVTQGHGSGATADVRRLVETATSPYCSENERCMMTGPKIVLPDDMAVPVGLILHELVTNAVKYGAWSKPGGTIEVDWQQTGGALRLHWRELGGLPAPQDTPRGFGTQLIESSARQFGGSIERRYRDDGLDVTLTVPLVG